MRGMAALWLIATGYYIRWSGLDKEIGQLAVQGFDAVTLHAMATIERARGGPLASPEEADAVMAGAA